MVLSHPTQYYSPWFRWLATHTALEFRVFYLWEFGVRLTLDQQFQKTFRWDVDLISGYDSEFVPNTSADPGTHRFLGLRNRGLTRRLNAWQPSAVLLFGYKSPSQLAVLAWARFRSIPLIFRGDSHLLGRVRLGALTRLALKILYAQFSALTYVGAANRDYFASLGVPACKLFFAPHAVNDALFDPARAATIAATAAVRSQLGLAASAKVILYAGKLVAAKQPVVLLTAFLELKHPAAALVFVGDGPEKEKLQAAARTAPAGAVHFLPFANQSEMPARYLLADIFCLPSRGSYETWGLAVNEAMHMGVPCLVSDRVGCQQDLVSDGETGWVFRAEDHEHLREKLSAALGSDLADFRPRVATRIAAYTYAQTSGGLLRVLQSLPAFPVAP